MPQSSDTIRKEPARWPKEAYNTDSEPERIFSVQNCGNMFEEEEEVQI